MKEIEIIKVYTVPTSETDMFVSPSGEISRSLGPHVHFDTMSLYQSNMSNIPNMTNTTIFRHQGIPLIRICKETKFWKEFTEILNKTIIHGSESGNLLPKAKSGLQLTLTIFKNEPLIMNKHSSFQSIIKYSINMFLRFVGENDPPLEILSICMDLLTETVKNFRSVLIPRMNNHKLLPNLFKEAFKYEDMSSMDSFNMGIIGTIILSNHKIPDHHLLVISFLKFLRTCLHVSIKHTR